MKQAHLSALQHMPEDFLQFIWQERYTEPLQISDQWLKVISPGTWNHNQGPDFLFAHVRLGELQLHGHIEIHRHSREWYQHGHHQDPHYNPVVLHVCLESDGKPILRADGTTIPEIIMQPILPAVLQARYDQLRLAQTQLSCEPLLPSVPHASKHDWILQLAQLRLQHKYHQVQTQVADQVQDWEAVLWQELLARMGGPQNQDAFRTLAERLPYSLVRHYATDLQQIEALLFGAAAWLKPAQDAYQQRLQETWHFLAHKHQLTADFPVSLSFFRLRPAAFPTLRLAQVAALVQAFPRLSDLLDPAILPSFLAQPIRPSAYWETHYRFGKETRKHAASLGQSQKHVLIINVLLPLMMLYQAAHGMPDPFAKAMALLHSLPAEQNRLTHAHRLLAIPLESAAISQGLIHLQKHFCQPKRCLQCQIGWKIMRGERE